MAKHLGNLKFRVWEKMQEIVQYSKCIYPFQTQNTHTQAQRETERERVYLHTQRQFDVLYINKSRKNLQKKYEDK